LKHIKCRYFWCNLATNHKPKTNANVVTTHTDIELNLILIAADNIQKPVAFVHPWGAKHQAIAAVHVGSAHYTFAKEIEVELGKLAKPLSEVLDFPR